MAVQNTRPIDSYVANGTLATFNYTFRIINLNDLRVFIDGVEQLSGFAVTGINNPSGGTVIFTTPPLAGAVIRLSRQVETKRDTDFIEGGSLRSDTLDNDQDRTVMMIQDLNVQTFKLSSSGMWDAQNIKIENAADPEQPDQVATKQYVDSLLVGLGVPVDGFTFLRVRHDSSNVLVNSPYVISAITNLSTYAVPSKCLILNVRLSQPAGNTCNIELFDGYPSTGNRIYSAVGVTEIVWTDNVPFYQEFSSASAIYAKVTNRNVSGTAFNATINLSLQVLP